MIAWATLLLAAAQVAPTPAEAAARAALAAQAEAWNRGDLDNAFLLYCPAPEMTWINRSGVTRGFSEFAAAMRSDFGDAATMGRMHYELLESRPVGSAEALTVIRWRIERDGRRIMGGVSTQLWRSCGGALRVVLEHAS